MGEKEVQFALQSLSLDGLLEPLGSLDGHRRYDTARSDAEDRVRAAVALPLVTTLLVATPKAHLPVGAAAAARTRRNGSLSGDTAVSLVRSG